MIPIHKESKELYQTFKIYEVCVFCGKETDMWHKESNKPVCTTCSKIHDISELKKLIDDNKGRPV